MSKLIDLSGQRFGRLTVIERKGTQCGHPTWRCLCDCGEETIVASNHLRSGAVTSCGCFRQESITRKNTMHNGTKTRLFRIWKGVLQRCFNKNNPAYMNYGGRGITTCQEWQHSFECFRDWALSNGYTDNLTIDRVNNDGNYCPENCRWATRAEQNRNKRNGKRSR